MRNDIGCCRQPKLASLRYFAGWGGRVEIRVANNAVRSRCRDGPAPRDEGVEAARRHRIAPGRDVGHSNRWSWTQPARPYIVFRSVVSQPADGEDHCIARSPSPCHRKAVLDRRIRKRYATYLLSCTPYVGFSRFTARPARPATDVALNERNRLFLSDWLVIISATGAGQ